MRYQDVTRQLKASIAAIQGHRGALIEKGQFGSPAEKKLSGAARMVCKAIDDLNELEIKEFQVTGQSYVAPRNGAIPSGDEYLYGDWPYVPHTGDQPKGGSKV